MYKLRYAKEVENDLKAIFNYIAEDSETRASQYLGKLEKHILQLESFPETGHLSRYNELRALGIRILPFENYLIFYTISKKEEAVNIIRILHGSVNYKNLF